MSDFLEVKEKIGFETKQTNKKCLKRNFSKTLPVFWYAFASMYAKCRNLCILSFLIKIIQ